MAEARSAAVSSAAQALLGKLAGRSALIGVVGLGYVGLPLALRYAQAGYPVLGFDIDAAKVEALAQGRSYIGHIRLPKPLAATTDFSRAGECDALIICVPTPLKANREPDLGFVLATLESLLPQLRAGQILSLESTTWPGTTEEELRPRIEALGLKVGADLFLCFSPEREDPGNAAYTTRSIPKVCGGSTPACLEAGLALYGQVIDRVVPVSSTRAAEMTKLLENVHRAVNIGLANEMKIICERMGIDVHEVIRAAATKPFGFVPYWPGPGLGGHCIPIDPFYLAWKARQQGLDARFIELAGEINRGMPAWVIGRLEAALAARGESYGFARGESPGTARGAVLRGCRVLVLGIAYKKNIGDVRESPAAALMDLLVERGASVEYSDPHVPQFPPMREHHYELKSVALTPARIAASDVLLLATDHDAFDYALLQRHAKLIVDTRGRYPDPLPNVLKA